MTLTNTGNNGCGIHMRNAKVELIDVAITDCIGNALEIPTITFETTTLVATRCEFSKSEYGAAIDGSLTSATFNNCVFNDNEHEGIFISNKATVHFHGEATAIHSNERHGIYALNSGKVVIHLPSHHNTCYNNRSEDRRTVAGGTITNVVDRST